MGNVILPCLYGSLEGTKSPQRELWHLLCPYKDARQVFVFPSPERGEI